VQLLRMLRPPIAVVDCAEVHMQPLWMVRLLQHKQDQRPAGNARKQAATGWPVLYTTYHGLALVSYDRVVFSSADRLRVWVAGSSRYCG
jgi:hypothetical protein